MARHPEDLVLPRACPTQDAGFYLCHDRIRGLAVLPPGAAGAGPLDCVLACSDRRLRVVRPRPGGGMDLQLEFKCGDSPSSPSLLIPLSPPLVSLSGYICEECPKGFQSFVASLSHNSRMIATPPPPPPPTAPPPKPRPQRPPPPPQKKKSEPSDSAEGREALVPILPLLDSARDPPQRAAPRRPRAQLPAPRPPSRCRRPAAARKGSRAPRPRERGPGWTQGSHI